MGFDSAKPRNRPPANRPFLRSVIDLGGHARYKLIDLFCPVRAIRAAARAPRSLAHVVQVEVVVPLALSLRRLSVTRRRRPLLNCPLRTEEEGEICNGQ